MIALYYTYTCITNYRLFWQTSHGQTVQSYQKDYVMERLQSSMGEYTMEEERLITDDDDDDEYIVYCYDPSQDKWTTLPPLSVWPSQW